ncbi:MAG: potassium-transporting ATPase subunit KdpB, partial [Desulfobacteraceae bacterium]|nr:potassium-transporting ATPase subunit KdpB [Desulfobacteraceae bacterium]
MATIWQPKLLKESAKESFIKLNPATLWRNPVMFIVEIGAVITVISGIWNAISGSSYAFHLHISLWLWFTVLFANFAEAFAEIQGKARADNLRKTRSNLNALKLSEDGTTLIVSALDLKKGDMVIVKDNEMIPGDGDIISGTSLVDESAITGESAPVIRESGGDRCGVTGGTKVLSGTIKIRITAEPGSTFIDNIISMVESAKRSKTQNEIALEILLITLTALFIVVIATLPFFSRYMNVELSVTVLIAFLVCLMPTTIGGLLPAIGIAGMDRLLQHNVIALSGRAVEAAGDVNYVLLDKTGTITLGNRMANEFIPAPKTDIKTLIDAAVLSSLSDETPEGRSIIVCAKKVLNIRGREIRAPQDAEFVPFTASSRMSGINIGDRKIRKGAYDAVKMFVAEQGGVMPEDIETAVESVAKNGDTPLVVAENGNALGVIRLKDIVKEGIR